MDEIAGCGRHPYEGDRVAEEEHGVGAGALGACEPVGEEDQHRGEDEAFRSAEEEPIEREQPEVADDAGERGEDAPAEQSVEDEAAGAFASCVGSAGD